MNNQWADSEKIKKSDYVIYNNDLKDTLLNKSNLFIKSLLKRLRKTKLNIFVNVRLNGLSRKC